MMRAFVYGFLILCCVLFIRETEGLGAASIVGIDYGSDTFKVMTLKGNAPEIILNDQSGRKTDTLVGFDISGERVFGSRAAQLRSKYPNRVISSAHQFLGKRYPDSSIENSRHLFPFDIVNNNGTYGFQIDDAIYTPEEIVGMMLEYARNMAATVTGSTPTDCTIVVPPYITQLERLGFMNAAKLANLNVLSLVHEGTATAVQYLRSRLLAEENKEQYTIFYNVGASHASATLTRFLIQKPERKVNRRIITNTTTWEEVGGRDFDDRLMQFLLHKAEESFKQDLSLNSRVIARLTKESRKVKEVLSANKEAHVRIESLLPDQDFSTKVTRAEFERMCADLFERAMKPIHQLLERTSVPKENIDVEVIGGGSRVLKINEYLSDIFGVDKIGRHLNGDEASLSGAMLYAATTSAGKKSSFTVKDTINRPVGIDCDLPDFEAHIVLKAESRLRAHKNLNVYASEPFQCRLYYDDVENLSSGTPADINTYEIFRFPNISALTISEEDPNPSVQVRFDIDNRGIILCEEAKLRVSVVETTPETEVEPEDSSNEPEQNEPNTEEVKENETVETETEESEKQDENTLAEEEQVNETEDVAESEEVPSAALEVKMKTFNLKVKKLENPYELNSTTIYASRARLAQLNREDKQRLLRDETKNELESYVYATLDFLDSESTIQVSTAEERESFSEALNEAGDWLYDDGFDATLEEYQEKLSGLKEIGDRIAFRAAQVEARPFAAASFHEWKQLALESLENIVTERNVGEEEKESLIADIREIEAWLETKQEEQANLPLHETPVWTSDELIEKVSPLDTTLKRFQRRRIRTPTPSPSPSIEQTEEIPNFENIDFDEIPIPVDELINEEEQGEHIHEEL